ncbi:TrmH family RNA methyltransferase [Propionicimonas sp.]|uniref:TrmH family RNA methyltransferase n=1 Tax=Propionicimonas sp. TaxID=1955623 RepID=UPI0039E5D469
MATLIRLDDASDPRLADYVGLREATLRRLLETEQGLFIAEGSTVIRRAVEAGYPPRSFLLAERWLAGLADLLDGLDVPVYVVTEELAESVTGFHVHRGALASLYRVGRYTVADVLAGRRVMVLEDLVDHTNVGAIARNAAGLGWDGMLVSAHCADPLYRRSVKVSMGTVLSLPWARLDERVDLGALLHGAGYRVAALALSRDAVDLASFAAALGPDERVAVLLGTEGHGLSAAWLGAADAVVTIPMRAGVDSLNVAAASAIAGYVLA